MAAHCYFRGNLDTGSANDHFALCAIMLRAVSPPALKDF
jgi:hypothetical protein